MQRWAPTVLAVIICALVTACPSDPNSERFGAYYTEARGILDAHGQLGQQYRKFNTSEDAEDADKAMEFIKKMTPGLQTLSSKAAAMSFPDAPRLGALNQKLVEALTQKFQAYESMTKAWDDGDLEQFEKSRAQAVNATRNLISFEQELEQWKRYGGPPPQNTASSSQF